MSGAAQNWYEKITKGMGFLSVPKF